MKSARIAVVKVGGKEVAPGPVVERFARWVAAEGRQGRRLVIVHGGGEEISERAAALGLPTEKHLGQRVTSAPMLEVVLEVLAGRINARLVTELDVAGRPSVGLTGLSGRLLGASLAGDPPGALGYVGRPVEVRTLLLTTLLDRGFTPVVAPIGLDPTGRPLNVNADLAAGAIAKALGADLWLVTDVPGVRDAAGAIAHRVSIFEARRMVARGVARGGMIPKLEAAEGALTPDNSVWIGDLDGLLAASPDRGSTIVAGRPGPVPMPAPRATGRRRRS
ncbi:MAG TPA: acetylglutamate kinase [Thermoplasmata archaeon]|nr:acetylglutamate kinase [Thermoplasmata archaeon]